jgi:predicted kinase
MQVGAEGYAVIHELAVSNLLLGIDVIVDAVNPVPEARMGWREAAHRGRARLLQVQTWLPDPREHRRRVEARPADMPGQHVPSWDQVEGQPWVPWDDERDGPCTRIDTSDSARAVASLLDLVDRP